MLSSAVFKKIRSISDGNFHGCYASNKAEKFKFRRLSQGIESCAQAQALKSRKEEKELIKMLNVLEKEKEKHAKERRDKQYYSQLIKTVDNLQYDIESENQLSCNNVSFIDPVESSNIGLTKKSTNELQAFQSSSLMNSNLRKRSSQIRKSSNQIRNSVAEFCKSPNQLRKSSNQIRKSSNKLSKSSTQFKQSSLYKSQDIEEVVPFYMQHTYGHYHYDPHYDDLLKTSNEAVSKESKTENDEPSWKKSTTLSRLKQRQPSNVKTNESIHKWESEEGLLPPARPQTPCLLKEQHSIKASNALLPEIKSTLHDIKSAIHEKKLILKEKLSSVLTPLERQELANYHRSGRSNSIGYDTERKIKTIADHRNQRRNTYHNVGDLLHIKNMIRNRLAKGADMKDVLSDELIDDLLSHCDEGRVYPAYREDLELTFDDFRALRKCKYLRLSKLNWLSLKQATLDAMSLI